MHSHVAYRSFYPKTNMPKATEAHPVNFEKLDETFAWATKFLQRLSEKLGPDFVCKKLSSWRWLLSTCFSGIGCPELVLSSDRNCKLSKQQCPLVLVCEIVAAAETCWNSGLINLEAVLSLQAAANKFLARHSKKKPSLKAQKVVLASSCEIDAACQQVLQATFGQDGNHCLFPDILKLGDGCEMAFCLAHKKKCCTMKPASPFRNSSCIQYGCLSSRSKKVKFRYYNWRIERFSWFALTKKFVWPRNSNQCLWPLSQVRRCKIINQCPIYVAEQVSAKQAHSVKNGVCTKAQSALDGAIWENASRRTTCRTKHIKRTIAPCC